MKKMLLPFLLIACIVVSYAQVSVKSKRIDTFMTTLYSQGQFSGAILVAEHGKVLYKKAFGFANRPAQERFTTSTACYIGSLSKQFTAMGIMILKDRKKLDYDASIRLYFPLLPAFMQPVTIRNLLTHSSGLTLFNDYPNMNEQDAFNILLKQDSLRFPPGERFEYCNANYTLLGMLIAKVSNSSLNDFLTKNIFTPTGMTNSYVDQVDTKFRKRAVGYYLFGDEYNYSTYVGGAASVVSSVDDLYKWDQALYNPKIVTSQYLTDAFTPQIKTGYDAVYGEKGYGFGWFVSNIDGDTIIQHDGGFAGFRSYIERQTNKHNTIIFISNVRHSLIGQIRQAINNMLHNKPYEIPKMSYANWIIAEAKKTSMGKAIEKYTLMAGSKDSSRYYFSENEFNSLGYYLMRNNKTADAIQFFLLNTAKNPTSSNAFDSLGEAYMNVGNKEQAIANYKRSLALDPANNNAANMIKKLQAAP